MGDSRYACGRVSPEDCPAVAVLEERTKTILELLEKRETHYVTKEEFNPVKSIVYGMVAFILLAVLGAGISYIVKNENTKPTRNAGPDSSILVPSVGAAASGQSGAQSPGNSQSSGASQIDSSRVVLKK